VIAKLKIAFIDPEEPTMLEGLSYARLKADIRKIFNEAINQFIAQFSNSVKNKAIFEVNIQFASDAYIATLNQRFRGKNKPTNVLSFPEYPSMKFIKGAIKTIEKNIFLGDIIVSLETCSLEAMEQNKSYKNHVLHMSLHGFLHLCGYDHVDEKGAKIMENLEIKLLDSLGVSNPYS
jgi:probable rRNA maturation factor